MMTLAFLLAVNLASWWRDTNSHAANARGVSAFARKQYGQAVKAFGDANRIAPTAQSAFNLGTAEVAAGNREQGSTTLSRAMRDPHLRADALFNRGNSALAANAFDYAIRDYRDVLRLRPYDAAAKRNLEIALARKSSMRRQGGGAQPEQHGASPRENRNAPQQAAPDERQQKQDADIQALLRSVQQQEEEELQRMHRGRGEKLHVGW